MPLATSSALRAMRSAVLPPHFFHQLAGALVQIVDSCGLVTILLQVAGNGADVLVDGPLVVVEDHDQALGVVGDVVERLVGDAAGEGRIAGHGDDVLLAAQLVARHRHAERGGERRAGVSGAVAIVRAFGAQHEAVQPARRADGVELLLPAGQQLVDIAWWLTSKRKLSLGVSKT